jgi:hypothetical protein
MTTVTIEQKLVDNAKNGVWLEFEKFIDANGNKVFEAPTLKQINDDNISIDADSIRNILLGLDTDKPIQGVFIRGAIIKGKLDLKDATLKGFTLPPLRLDDCLIIGDYKKDPDKKNDLFDPVIDARYCNLKRLTLKRSRIGIIDIRGAKVDGNLDMESVKPFRLRPLKYKFWAIRCIYHTLVKHINSKPPTVLSNACLIAENTTINGNINLRACELRLYIPKHDIETKLEYTEALCLYEAKVAGSLMVYEEKIVDPITKKVISYNCPKIFGRVSLSYAEFSKNIWFYDTTIVGDKRDRSKTDDYDIAITASGLKCQAFRIAKRQNKDCCIKGSLEMHYTKMWYLQFKEIVVDGHLSLGSINIETNVEVLDTTFNDYVYSGYPQKVKPIIDLRNAEINSDLKLEKINCPIILANNSIIAGRVSVSEFPPRDQVKAEWVDSHKGYISYSNTYEDRQIDFDNACIGSDFSISECFVGLIKTKNIRVKGDTKFIDTFARLNLKLANIEGDFSIDNSNATVLASALTEDHTFHKFVFSGIPKITVNDIEVAGKVALDELIINAEYNLGDAKPEIDFSGGRFKSAFIIGNITFIRTFKPSRPTFSLDDAVIEGDLHFEKNKQLVKHVDKFCSHFTKKFDLPVAKQPSIAQFKESEIKNILFSTEEFSKIKDVFKNSNVFQRFAYLLGYDFLAVFERENNKFKHMNEGLNSLFEALFVRFNIFADVLEKPGSFQSKFILFNITLKEKISSRIKQFINNKSGYFNGWDIKKLNHKTIKEYEISCYPNHNYVELISKLTTESGKECHATTAFLVHKIDKNLSIHLDGTSPPIHKLNSNKGNLVIKYKDDALQYLRFFCAHVRGEHGAFWVIEETSVLDELISARGPYYFYLKKYRQAIKNNIEKYKAEKHATNVWILENVVILYSEVFFLANFEVDANNGMVRMLDDEPIQELNSQVLDIKHYKYAYYREINKTTFSLAKVIGLDVKKPKIIDLEYARYVLLHLMHINFSLNSLISNTFKFDLNGKNHHNFGCGINLRLDGFEYKRLADNDEDLRLKNSNNQNPNSQNPNNQNPNSQNPNSQNPKKDFDNASTLTNSPTSSRRTDLISIDKYEGIEGVLDAQYDNHFWPTHNGFDSQPYEQMAKVLYKIGAYRPAKAVFLKKTKHEALAQHWRAKIKLRNKLIENKADFPRGILYLKHFIQYAIFSCSQQVELFVKPFKVRIKNNVKLYKARIKKKDESLYDEIKEYFSNRKAK